MDRIEHLKRGNFILYKLYLHWHDILKNGYSLLPRASLLNFWEDKNEWKGDTKEVFVLMSNAENKEAQLHTSI